jgi:hypothetical protein
MRASMSSMAAPSVDAVVQERATRWLHLGEVILSPVVPAGRPAAKARSRFCVARSTNRSAAAVSVAAQAAARAATRRTRLIVTRLTEPHHGTAARFPGSGHKTRLGVPLSPSLTGETRSLPCWLTRSA